MKTALFLLISAPFAIAAQVTTAVPYSTGGYGVGYQVGVYSNPTIPFSPMNPYGQTNFSTNPSLYVDPNLASPATAPTAGTLVPQQQEIDPGNRVPSADQTPFNAPGAGFGGPGTNFTAPGDNFAAPGTNFTTPGTSR